MSSLMCFPKKAEKRLAPPSNTKDRKHLQSTQTTVNTHKSQTKHQALSKGQPRNQDVLIGDMVTCASSNLKYDDDGIPGT